MADYKQYLKNQIEVFFRVIILFLLESPTSSFEHKWLCIQALTQICANSQCVVDLYVNYDCDLQSSNIFARLVNVLAKKAQGKQQSDMSCTPIQLKSQRLKGLECIVSILKCMVEWSRDLYVNPGTMKSNLGPENRPHLESDQYLEIAQTNKIRSYDSNNSLHSSNSGNLNQTTSANVTNNSIGGYDPTDFEAVKSKKEMWEKGIDLFNKKPKKVIY
jgi:brefeldin A-inhibited guanine nucleotide-exchange protein